MPDYIINRDPDTDGYHEAHELSPNRCTHLPDVDKWQDLGWYSTCGKAIEFAKIEFIKVYGCFYCCKAFHDRL